VQGPGPVVTLTANPSLDRTIDVPRLDRGEVLRSTGGRVDPGGKGVNVARALGAFGVPATAVFPSGGSEGRQLVDLLDALPSVAVEAVPISGSVRANVSVVEADGTVTKLNEPGPRLSTEELAALADAFVSAASSAGAAWAVMSGSLPPGAPADFYARLIPRLHAVGARVALDTSGPAFGAALALGPDLVKPNHEELGEVTGTTVLTLGDALQASAEVLDRGAGMVVASLGKAGAVLVTHTESVDPLRFGPVHAEAPVARPRSTVGAGDSALAGFLFGGAAGADGLAQAVAWGAAATSLEGSRLPVPSDLAATVPLVVVHDRIDPDRPIGGAPGRPSGQEARHAHA